MWKIPNAENKGKVEVKQESKLRSQYMGHKSYNCSNYNIDP
jgi:hypothetical protein